MITKDTIITDFLKQYPEHVHILTEAGFPCVGCFMADGETIEMGCLEAGIDVYDLIDTINDAIDNSSNNTNQADNSNENSDEKPQFTSGIKE